MNSKELSEKTGLNEQTRKAIINALSMVTGTRPLRNWDSPERDIIGVLLNLTIIKGPSAGQTLVVQVQVNDLPDDLVIGSQVVVTSVNGISIHATSRQNSTYVDLSLTLKGKVKKVQ